MAKRKRETAAREFSENTTLEACLVIEGAVMEACLVTKGATLEACLVTEGAVMEACLVTNGATLEACLVTEGVEMDDRNECSTSGNENRSSDHESTSSGNDVDADIRPSYKNDTVSEVHHDINIVSDIPNMDSDRHTEEHDYVDYEQQHAFFTFLINNLKCDVEKRNEVNCEAQQIKLLYDEISNLNSQVCEKDKTFTKENEKYDELRKAGQNDLDTRSSFSEMEDIYHHPDIGIFSSSSYDDDFGGTVTNLAPSVAVDSVSTKRVNTIHPQLQILSDLTSPIHTRGTLNVAQALNDPACVEAMQEEMQRFVNQKVWQLVPLPEGKFAIGTK
ncbi:hypothetical protein Tco_0523324 [Tanacetum coccineum]